MRPHIALNRLTLEQAHYPTLKYDYQTSEWVKRVYRREVAAG